MRSSDWSSDVCSSDLVEGESCPARARQPGHPARARHPGGASPRAHGGSGKREPGVGGKHGGAGRGQAARSEEHTSELQSLMRISYAVFCLKKKKQTKTNTNIQHY